VNVLELKGTAYPPVLGDLLLCRFYPGTLACICGSVLLLLLGERVLFCNGYRCIGCGLVFLFVGVHAPCPLLFSNVFRNRLPLLLVVRRLGRV
jgi:hypothetical protein